MNAESESRGTRLWEIASLFLKLGATAFGGPAAHIALMEEEVVIRRGWLSHAEFLDLLGATNLIPGPNSTELAIHIGHRHAGWLGLLTAGVSFVLPAGLLVTGLAWAYVRFGTLPTFAGILSGVKPVIVVIVAQALWRLGRAAIKTPYTAVLGLAIACLNAAGIHELVLLFGAGLFTVATRAKTVKPDSARRSVWAGLAPWPILPLAAMTAPAATPVSLGMLFLFFLKIGSVLFGSGYVLLAFLRADLVERWHWLTETQLLDAIAVGQITPGPLLTTATFIGYVLAGTQGAVLATVGIFLPAFVFVAISGPLIPRIRTSARAGAFLDGVNLASLALMAVVSAQLTAVALVDWLSLLLGIGAAFGLWRTRVNSVWLLFGGGAIGWLKWAWMRPL